MSLLKYDTARKYQKNNDLVNLDINLNLNIINKEEYKIKSVKNNAVYLKKA